MKINEEKLNDVLICVRKKSVAIICESKQEAIWLFNFKFPYKISYKRLYEADEWVGDYKEQGFVFDYKGNGYSRASYFIQNPNYEIIRFKELLQKLLIKISL